ncbi:cyclic lactone autoinducer peptide [Paenibacillus wynnii]|nr:cyclic lactone autoinducer peptide [Paenibacillus wynnii]
MKIYKYKNMFKVWTGAASLLSLMAVILVSTASVFYVHQPETPEELLK